MWTKRRGPAALALACMLAGGGFDIAAQDKDKEKDKEKIKNVYVAQDKFVITRKGEGASVRVGQGAGHGAGHGAGQGAGQGEGHGIGRGQGGGNTFVFVSSEMMIDGKVVKGAPYSAEAVTETAQTLADGNRIVRKNTAQVYRDSEGRTRREQTFGAIGPFASEGEPTQTVFINDPVAGINYILDPNTRSARKMVMPRFNASWRLPEGLIEKPVKTVYPPIALAAKAQGTVKVLIDVNEAGEVTSAKVVSGHPLLQQSALDAAKQLRLKPAMRDGAAVKAQRDLFFDFKIFDQNNQPSTRVILTPEGKGPEGMPPPPPPHGKGQEGMKRREGGYVFNAPMPPPPPGGHGPDVMFYSHDGGEPKIESLGTQTVEGVQAEGKRITHTIPAGAVGNEREINIVNEHWYSSELQTMVMTRHSDPRFGETTFRLTNISRTEPSGALFQLPSDYTVKEGGAGVPRQMRMKKGEPKEEMKFHFEMKPDEN